MRMRSEEWPFLYSCQPGSAIAYARHMRLETRGSHRPGRESKETEVSPCPVCGYPGRSLHMTVHTIRAYRVKRCRRCHLVYTTPRPTGEELASFYSGQYFVGGDHRFGYEDYGGCSLGALNAERMWNLLRLWEPAINEVSHSLLDVGLRDRRVCPSGAECGMASIGRRAAWLKPASRRRCGGVVTYDALSDVRGSYGLITMFQVLEHMVDPLIALSGAKKTDR